MGKNRFGLRFLAIIAGCLASRVCAQPIVAVLSSDTGPYREALAGFKQELGESTPSFFLSQGEPAISSSTQVIVTFGTKAAMRKYAERANLVYAMAPGAIIQDSVRISMEPDHSVLLRNMKMIQPSIKRLGIFWVGSRFMLYADELREAAKPLGIAIESSSMESSADLPDRLRKIYGKIDAIWLFPDPLLINAESLAILVEFSKTSRVPVYVSTAGLIDQGATVAIGPSFREIGRMAADMARKTLRSQGQGNSIYPTNVEIVINKAAATQIGLSLSEEALQKANRVVP